MMALLTIPVTLPASPVIRYEPQATPPQEAAAACSGSAPGCCQWRTNPFPDRNAGQKDAFVFCAGQPLFGEMHPPNCVLPSRCPAALAIAGFPSEEGSATTGGLRWGWGGIEGRAAQRPRRVPRRRCGGRAGARTPGAEGGLRGRGAVTPPRGRMRGREGEGGAGRGRA